MHSRVKAKRHAANENANSGVEDGISLPSGEIVAAVFAHLVVLSLSLSLASADRDKLSSLIYNNAELITDGKYSVDIKITKKR